MIKSSLITLFLTTLLSLFSTTKGQFVNIQLTIEPELSATVVTDLSFGSIISGSGIKVIDFGDPAMGVFNIRGFKNQRVFIDSILPDELTHLNPAIDSSISLDLSLAVNNSGRNDFRDGFRINETSTLIDIHDPTILGNSNSDVWETLYVYVFGSIDVGNVPNGEYEGDILLIVQYD